MARQARRHPASRQRQHRRDERLARLRLAARRAGGAPRHGEGLCAGVRCNAHGVASRRRARRRCGNARDTGGRCSCAGGAAGRSWRRAAVRSSALRPSSARWARSSGSWSSSSSAMPRSHRSLAALSLPVAAVLLDEPWPVIVFAAGAAAAVLVLHRPNIARLRAGTENRFRFRRLGPRATRVARCAVPRAPGRAALRVARRPFRTALPARRANGSSRS